MSDWKKVTENINKQEIKRKKIINKFFFFFVCLTISYLLIINILMLFMIFLGMKFFVFHPSLPLTSDYSGVLNSFPLIINSFFTIISLFYFFLLSKKYY